MQDTLAVILLIAIVVSTVVSVYVFTSSVLANLFSSPETQFQLTLPLRIEKTLVQGTQTCFIIRNPNPEPVDTNTIAIYINGRLYTHTSDCNQVLPKSICRLCITYTPSGGEEVKISSDEVLSSVRISQETTPNEIDLYCSSCSECNYMLNHAKAWADANNALVTVHLTKDISTSDTCISISNIDFNGVVVFDGGGHVITSGVGGYGIYINNVSGLNVQNISLDGFYHGIYLVSSSRNTFLNINTSNSRWYGLYLVSSNNNSFSNIISSAERGIYVEQSFENNFSDLNLNNSSALIVFKSTSNTFSRVRITSASLGGIYLYQSTSNNFSDVWVFNSGRDGVKIWDSPSNSFTDLNLQGNGWYDINIIDQNSCSNTFTNVTVSRNKPLYYCNSACELNGLKDTNLQDASLIILCDADGSKVEHVNVCGQYCQDGNTKNNGIIIIGVDNSEFNDINSSYNFYGILVEAASSNTFSNLTANNNDVFGIYIHASSSNTFSTIMLNNNTQDGILVSESASNIFSEIIAYNNGLCGLFLMDTSSNTISRMAAANNDTGLCAENAFDNISLSSGNSSICGNTYYDLDLYDSNITCTDCNSGFLLQYNTIYGSGLSCDCNSPCP